MPSLSMSAISRMLAVDRVVVADVGVEVAREPVDGLLERLVEVRLHHRPHLPRGQLRGFAPLRKSAISLPFAYQASCACPSAALSPAFAACEQRDGAEDVRAKQLGELRARGRAVVRPDRVADVRLVLQQARLGRRQVGQAAGEADDRQARPGDVVLPELAHVVVQALRPWRRRARRVGRAAVCSWAAGAPPAAASAIRAAAASAAMRGEPGRGRGGASWDPPCR